MLAPRFKAQQEKDYQRRDARYRTAGAAVLYNGAVFKVEDWSAGGVRFRVPNPPAERSNSFYALNPAKKLYEGGTIQLTLQFTAFGDKIDLAVTAEILRLGDGLAAARFTAMPPDAARKFSQVRDMLAAEEFLSSQQSAA